MASDSTDYYNSHPGAYARKKAYMEKYMQTETAKRIRLNADRANARLKKEGKGGTVGDGKDYSHRDGKLVEAGTHRSKDKKLKPNKRKLHIT